jgi:hypothetical protein
VDNVIPIAVHVIKSYLHTGGIRHHSYKVYGEPFMHLHQHYELPVIYDCKYMRVSIKKKGRKRGGNVQRAREKKKVIEIARETQKKYMCGQFS